MIKRIFAVAVLLITSFDNSAFCQDPIIDKYFAAIGGREAWKQVKSVEKNESGAFLMDSRWIDVLTTTYFQDPNRYCYVGRFAFGNKGVVFNGVKGHELMFDRRIREMSDQEVESRMKRVMFPSYANLILAATAVNFLAERNHEGRKYFVYLINSAAGWSAEYYFDQETYLLGFIRVAPTDNFICFYDYKEINGLLWPTRIIGTENIDNPVNERNLIEIKVNEKIDTVMFSKKYLELLKVN